MTSELIIETLKNKVASDIINDEEIVNAIDSRHSKDEDWSPIFLMDNLATSLSGYTPHIYTYKKFPETIEDVITFLIITVQIPKSFDSNKIWAEPILEIWIFSHMDHMRVNNKAVKCNRNDYLSRLIKSRFYHYKEAYDFKFESDIEDAYNEKFLYRKLTFTCKSLNEKLCEVDL